jgi:hypothetical protein
VLLITYEARIVQKNGRPKKEKLQLKVWFVGRVYKMHRNLINCWLESKDLIDLINRKETNNKWTYDLMDHLRVDLETIIALASTTYIVDLDAYELHPEMEKSSMTLLMKTRVLHYAYDKVLVLFKKFIFVLNINDYTSIFFYIYIFSLVFISLILYVY